MPRSVAATAILFGLLVVACGAAELVVPATPEPFPEEHMPLWASLAIVGEPAVAERDLELEIRNLPDGEVLRTATFPTGTVIRWEEGLGEGPVRIIGEDGRCTHDVDLPAERRTTIAVHQDDAGCAFGPASTALPDDSSHLNVMVTAQPWAGLLVDVVALDTPAQPVPAPVPPDEGGLAQLGPIYPGRYEVRLARGAEILERVELTVVDGPPSESLIQLEMDGVPDAP